MTVNEIAELIGNLKTRAQRLAKITPGPDTDFENGKADLNYVAQKLHLPPNVADKVLEALQGPLGSNYRHIQEYLPKDQKAIDAVPMIQALIEKQVRDDYYKGVQSKYPALKLTAKKELIENIFNLKDKALKNFDLDDLYKTLDLNQKPDRDIA